MPRLCRLLLPLALAAGLIPTNAAYAAPPPFDEPPRLAEASPFAQAKALAGDWIDQRFRSQASHSAAGAADVIFALAGTGGHAGTIDLALDVLADTTPGYIGEPGAVTNAGGLAKVMLAVQVAGGDPAGFAGYDLETELRDRIAADGTVTGVNLFAASLAISALARTEDGVPPATADWYAARQCREDGHANLGGYGWGGNACVTADADTTAMALQALLVTGQDPAAARATGWLLADQSPAGGFGGNDNTNSTGLAGQALRAAGEVDAADRAGAHVAQLQFGPDTANPDHVGGIRWLPGQAAPNAMATHQAVLALGAPSFAELAAVPGDDGTGPEPEPTAGPSPTPGPGGAAAGGGAATAATSAGQWLAGQLVDGGVPGFAGTDWGLTIDVLIALVATGADPAAAGTVADALETNVDGYAQPVPGLHIAGATAKLLYAAAISAGRDPTDFGGHDLRRRTLDLVPGPEAGDHHGWLHNRYDDAATTGGNMFDQSLAVLGLAGTGDVPQPVVDFLIGQQCPAGGFRLFPPADGAPCTGDVAVLDPDTTGMAVQALLAADAAGATGTAAAVAAGKDWLLAMQRDSGAFHGSVVTDYPNSNSTGLAGQALAATDEPAAAERAAGWVAAQQVTVDSGAAAGHAGAIAYTPEQLADAVAGGIPDLQLDQWRRATAQAVLALAKVGLDEIGRTTPVPPPTPTTTAPPPTTVPPTTDPPGGSSTGGAGGTGGGLPVTGVPVGLLAAAGGGALVLGAIAIIVTRRRKDVRP